MNLNHDPNFDSSRRKAPMLVPAGLAVAGAATASPLLAKDGPIIMRRIPKTGEEVPAVGLGTFLTFDVVPGQAREHLREVLRKFWDGGGRVVDTSPLYGTAEVNVGDFATALGIGGQIFVANKVWSTGEFLADDSHARRSLDQSMQRLWRERIDVMQIHSLVNADALLPVLRGWKQDGSIRHLGVTHHEVAYFEPLAQLVERADLDFVQVHYSIHTRQAEERILRAAADRGTAVLVNMPFEKARLFKLVENEQLPAFAREFGADTWAQFFLKWVISHPAVTCVIPATSNPDHQADNIQALRGPLPDRAMRERMVRHMEGIPGFAQLAQTPWYPGKRYSGIIQRAQAQRMTMSRNAENSR